MWNSNNESSNQNRRERTAIIEAGYTTQADLVLKVLLDQIYDRLFYLFKRTKGISFKDFLLITEL